MRGQYNDAGSFPIGNFQLRAHFAILSELVFLSIVLCYAYFVIWIPQTQ